MQRNLQLLSVFKRAFQDEQLNFIPLTSHVITTIRCYAGKKSGTNIRPFQEVLDRRREEAQRSLLVQVQSEQSCGDLYNYCSGFGSVRNMYHYRTLKNIHYILVEMTHKPSADEIFRNTSHHDANQAIPVVSPFLWFKMADKKKGEQIKKNVVSENIHLNCPLECESNESLLKAINNEPSLCDQVKMLKKRTEINELGTRLRFLTARQLELGLSGLFRDIYACPFGSSVNGFGKNGCDLDLVLVFPDASSSSRLVFHAKACSADDRLQIQNHIEVIGDLMMCFMAGCVSVKKITQARVPIVKYRQELTNLDCDVSLYNTSCLQMSEVLYLLGSLDTRVQEMVMAVRAWAKAAGLTNPTPGRWISNFSLTLLVLFFLQQSSVKILPALTRLRHKKFIMSSDEFRSYAATISSQLPKNTMTSGEILLKFFQFYSNYDFGVHGLNLLTSKTVVKPDYSAMFIVNPVEPELNVSKNVSPEEVERLRGEMRNAAWILESKSQDRNEGDLCGLAKLLEGNLHAQSLANPVYRHRSRLVDVKSLFEG